MISLIVAHTRNRMIGNNGDFPWHLRTDLKRFKQLTSGHAVIMGRKTYDAIVQRMGKPLPNRRNIVITRDADFTAEGAEVAHSPEDAFALTDAENEEVFVIGGAQIYAACLPFADRLYITLIDAELDGDAFFPEIDETNWHETFREAHQKDEQNDYDFEFITFDRLR